MTTTGYLLQNARIKATERFAARPALFDPVALRQLDACGIAARFDFLRPGFVSTPTHRPHTAARPPAASHTPV
ncbi:hypothetical protein [Rhodanobacter thiooxydans]|uniref:hypothetical protein n=1 Tax=Rhodanobacter thiooxydans TaxID=416169 RepID=UPI000B235B6B|nr:hypothetical protein [Rhodanobacter thiooxydans]MCW0202659.1 hypothetical protein [Rhodanobacter thiooxydans]